jgi:hypothetical protein
VSDLNARPCNAATGSGTESFHCSFFGSKARGESLDRVLLAPAIANLVISEDARKKAISKASNRRADSLHFADIDSSAENHAAPEGSGGVCKTIIF